MDLSLTKPYGQCRLPDRLLAIPEYAEKYKTILKEAAALFTKEKLLNKIEEFESATKEILAKDAMAMAARKEGPGGGQFGAIPDLRTFAAKRTESIAAQIDGKSKGYTPNFGFGRPGGGGPGFGQPGVLIAPPQQEALKLTDEQKRQLAELQKDVDGKIEQLLTDEQRTQWKRMRENRGMPGPGFGPPQPPQRP